MSSSSDASEYDDDSDTSMTMLRRSAAHRNRRRHDATYGVFWEDDDKDGDRPSGRSIVNRKRKRRSDKQEGMQFVKGSTEEPKVDEQHKDPVAAAPPSTEATSRSDETSTSTPDPGAEKANQYFLSLLAKGKGRPAHRPPFDTTSSDQPSTAAPRAADADSPSRGGLGYRAENLEDDDASEEEEYDDTPQGGGLGFKGRSSSGFSGTGLESSDFASRVANHRETAIPMSFGRQHRADVTTNSNARPDPNVGQWEKHTKGIGMKLLSKMGYKGSGGLRANSTAAPVPVKVRPTNLGLGFGNFKEATSKPAAPEPQATPSSNETQKMRTSAIPSANDIMQKKTWKKRRDKRQESKADFVAYTDILESRGKGEAMTVIDMTGSESKVADDGPVPLGQEMLHNISILLGTFENRLHSESSFVQTHTRQQETFQADLKALQKQEEELKGKERKLETVLQLLDQMDTVLADASLDFTSKLKATQATLFRLAANFSAEERSQIQFAETIVPALLGAVVQPELDAWDPMQHYPNIPLIRSVLQCTPLLSGEGDASSSNTTMDPSSHENLGEIRKAMLSRHLIPKLRRTWQSSRWDPVLDMSAVEIFEALVAILKEIEPKPNGPDEESVLFSEYERKRTELSDIVREELIDTVVVKRLVQTLGYWDGLQLDHWILPWLPFVAPGNVPALVAECKHKLKAIMTKSALMSIKDNLAFFKQGVEILSPWRNILKTESLENMASEHIIPRLARHLSKCDVESPKTASPVLFDIHHRGLMSDRMLLSLLESELLTNVAKKALSWRGEPDGFAKIASCYCSWKQVCFGSSERLRILLSNDDGVCRALYAMLLIATTAQKAGPFPISFRSTNYRTTLNRRKKQAKRKAADDIIREMEPNTVAAEARVKLGGEMPTFRQVVEQLATSNGLLLIPKAGRRVDGRQIFELGRVAVYFEENIVYTVDGTGWKPVSLEALIKQAMSV